MAVIIKNCRQECTACHGTGQLMSITLNESVPCSACDGRGSVMLPDSTPETESFHEPVLVIKGITTFGDGAHLERLRMVLERKLRVVMHNDDITIEVQER